MIKAVIFDCFGVLTSDNWKEFAGAIPPAQRQAARSLNHAYDRGHLAKAAFLAAVKKLTGKQPNYIDDKLDEQTTKNHALLRYIASLKPTYKIGLLSNVATNWIREHFLTPDEQKLFDAFIFSYEVGATKPDPKMFETVAARLGVELNECVFIDDIDRFCNAARGLGMQAILYRDFTQMKQELTQILKA